jgi:O-antigen ligase
MDPLRLYEAILALCAATAITGLGLAVFSLFKNRKGMASVALALVGIAFAGIFRAKFDAKNLRFEVTGNLVDDLLKFGNRINDEGTPSKAAQAVKDNSLWRVT